MIIEADVIAIILMLGITGARVTFPGLATGSYLATKASLFFSTQWAFSQGGILMS